MFPISSISHLLDRLAWMLVRRKLIREIREHLRFLFLNYSAELEADDGREGTDVVKVSLILPQIRIVFQQHRDLEVYVANRTGSFMLQSLFPTSEGWVALPDVRSVAAFLKPRIEEIVKRLG